MSIKRSGLLIEAREDIYSRKGWKISPAFKAAFVLSWVPLFIMAVVLISLSLMAPIYLMETALENYDGLTSYHITDVLFLGAMAGCSYLLFGMGLLIFGPLLKRTIGIFIRQEEGEFPFLSMQGGYWSVVNGVILFNRTMFMELTRTTFLIVFFYRLMGMKVGKGTLINTTYIHDPDLITVGRNVTIGGDVMVLGHVGERGVLILRPVVIEDGVDIGQSSLVMPGCRLGKGSVIGAFSVVTKDTRVPPYEIWGGVPARKIGRVRPPGLP